MPITVRRATVADAAVLARIGAQSFRAAYAGSSSAEDIASHVDTHFRAASITAEFARADRAYLLATSSGRPAGLAKVSYGLPPEDIPAQNAVGLAQLYIATDCQRQGIGGRLVDAVERLAQDRTAAGIWLSVWQRADWAIRFYENHRFVKAGLMKFMVGETEHTDFLMWLPAKNFSRSLRNPDQKN